MQQVDYVGHIISKSGVLVDLNKTRALVEWPISTNLKSLKGFLGLTGYYRKFIVDYNTIASPPLTKSILSMSNLSVLCSQL